MSLDPRDLVAVFTRATGPWHTRPRDAVRICTYERWRHTRFRENRTLLSSFRDDTICPPAMHEPNDKAVSWRTKIDAAAPGWQPSVPPAAAPDAAIEVFEPDELLGIGPGTDILVVDDDAANLTAYEAALAPLGRRLVAAQSGI